MGRSVLHVKSLMKEAQCVHVLTCPWSCVGRWLADRLGRATHPPVYGIVPAAGRTDGRLYCTRHTESTDHPLLLKKTDNHKPDQLHVKSSCYYAALPLACHSHYSNRCGLNLRHSHFDGHSVPCVFHFIFHTLKV